MPPSHAYPVTVAIVDDDEAVCDALSALVRAAGWTALAYVSPWRALSNGALAGADCLVVDVQMAELDGLELVRRLRAGGVGAPAVFMTAHNRPGLEARTRAVGGHLLLEKPFDPEALLAAIAELLGAA